jgi:hypothetical protein
MTAEQTTPEKRENVAESIEAELTRRDVAIEQLVTPQVELVSGQVRDAARRSEGPAEAVDRLRQAEANIRLLIEVFEALE